MSGFFASARQKKECLFCAHFIPKQVLCGPIVSEKRSQMEKQEMRRRAKKRANSSLHANEENLARFGTEMGHKSEDFEVGYKYVNSSPEPLPL